MKDRDLARIGRRFIAESEPVTRRLIASDFPTESVLVIERKADEIAALEKSDVPVYVMRHELMNQLVGFKFHSGVLAVGRRKPDPLLSDVVPVKGLVTLVVCPDTNNTENLGMIIRVATGFGASAMLLGERCANPFYRQSIRVSMGTIFKLPIVQSQDLAEDLKWLKEQQSVERVATVVGMEAEPLASARRSERMAILFGNEGDGLGPQWLELCDRRVTIPMKLGTDSLNVHVAAAVILYELLQRK
jgi:tRNA G18 (ribose-2'-O)-methylase SpoU